MRVAINALQIRRSSGGVKTYLVNLVQHLSLIDDENTYFLFVTPESSCLFGDLRGNFSKIVIPLVSRSRVARILFEQLFLPLYVIALKIDVLFSPGNMACLLAPCKQVLTVHGALTIRKMRAGHKIRGVSRFRLVYYDLMLPLSVRKANSVIVVSQDSQRWLLRQTRVADKKVRVVHEGVSTFITTGSTGDVNFNVRKPYILFLSTLFPYKNADKLIRAFALAKGTHGIPHRLVIAGEDRCREAVRLRELAAELGVLEETQFLGRVPHEAVGVLYRNADVFVFPSSMETFGLPVLEAMSCGTPVVGSDRTAVPEIIGDAGIIIDPHDIAQFASAIVRVVSDPDLRGDLVTRGRRRVKEFTWEKAARMTLDIFYEVYGGTYPSKSRRQGETEAM